MEVAVDYYKINFIEIKPLGKGAFSTVFEVRDKSKNEVFAVKKIPFISSEHKKTLKEIGFLSQLSHDYVVKYIYHWVETNYYLNTEISVVDKRSLLLDPEKPLLLHLQTEICSMTLSEVITFLISSDKKNSITLKCFNISCEIFNQLLQCLYYLHNHNPQIIHRDLKPENIMLIEGDTRKCVKLLDFGLSTYHNFVDQSHTKYLGTKTYRAPELDEKYYDTKADIYSLGAIIKDLFNINPNIELNEIDSEIIESQYKHIKELSISCLEILTKNRPTCEDILNFKDIWINKIGESNLIFEINCLFNEKRQKLFYEKFVEKKYEKEFIEIKNNNDKSIIGSGDISSVYKVKSLSENKIYAIKKIKIKDLSNLKQTLQIIDKWSSLNHEMLLNYKSTWIEYVDFNINDKFEKISTLHIQMEFCLSTLERTLILINNELQQRSQYSLTPVGVYISARLFSEIVNGVYYLHSHQPPIIHGKLNLKNILISNYSLNSVIKLCDYDLSSNNSFEDKKLDVKSLGIILQNLFCVDLSRYDEVNRFYLEMEQDYDKFNTLYMSTTLIFRLIHRLINTSIDINFSINNILDEVKNFLFSYELIEDSLLAKLVTAVDKYPISKELISKFAKIPNTLNQENICFYYEKWPLLKHFKNNRKEKINFLYVVEVHETKVIYTKDDKTTHAIKLDIPQETKIINQFTNMDFRKIICGDSHVLCLTTKNQLFSFGNNEYGQLGIGSFISDNIPVIVPYLKDAKDIKCGAYFNIALTETGELFSWGMGKFGQLGNNSTSSINRPLKINSQKRKFESISCGIHHCLALSTNGDVYGWGHNEFGQLGIGCEQNQLSPQLINVTKRKFKKISCGSYHSLLLAVSEHVYAFGNNQFGQIGIGTHENQNFPVKVTNKIKFKSIETTYYDSLSVALSRDNNYYVWGKGGSNIPIKLDFISVYDIFLLFSDRKYLFQTIFRNMFKSDNDFNSLIQNHNIFEPTLIPKISSLSIVHLKEVYAIIVTNEDRVYKFRVCPSIDSTYIDPIEIPSLSKQKICRIDCNNEDIFCITEDKKLLTYRYAAFNLFYQIKNFEKVIPMHICRNIDYITVLSESGTVYNFGVNKFSEVDPKLKIISLSCGSFHFIAKSDNNQLLSWGRNTFGQLGINNTVDQNTPILVTTDKIMIKKACCGRNYTMLLSYDGVILSFGQNDFGQLGHNDQLNKQKPTKINVPLRFVDIASTFCDDISCALSSDGIYYIWGDCDEYILSPRSTELKSFDAIFAKYSKYRITANQINLNYL